MRWPTEPSVVALGGGHGLHASLSRACASTSTDRPHRGRHRRRQRRLVRPAARRVRRAAARRPADGAGRAVRRRRLGPDLGAGAPAPVRRRRRDARPRGRQPADRRRSGSCSATTSTASTGSAGCSAPAAGCCRWRSTPLDITAEVRGARPGRPRRASTASAARSRSPPPTASIVLGRARPAPTRRPAPRRVDGDPRGRLGRARARVVVHLGDPAPAGARAARGAGRDRRRGRWSSSTSRPQAGETAGLRPGRPPRRCSPSTPRTCSVHTVLADRPLRRGRRRRSRRSSRRTARGWSSPTSPRRDGTPRHDPVKLAAAYARDHGGSG